MRSSSMRRIVARQLLSSDVWTCREIYYIIETAVLVLQDQHTTLHVSSSTLANERVGAINAVTMAWHGTAWYSVAWHSMADSHSHGVSRYLYVSILHKSHFISTCRHKHIHTPAGKKSFPRKSVKFVWVPNEELESRANSQYIVSLCMCVPLENHISSEPAFF